MCKVAHTHTIRASPLCAFTYLCGPLYIKRPFASLYTSLYLPYAGQPCVTFQYQAMCTTTSPPPRAIQAYDGPRE